MDKQQGAVQFFNAEKGFGFIRHNDSMEETFFNVSGLDGLMVHEGDAVPFDLMDVKERGDGGECGCCRIIPLRISQRRDRQGVFPIPCTPPGN